MNAKSICNDIVKHLKSCYKVVSNRTISKVVNEYCFVLDLSVDKETLCIMVERKLNEIC